MRFAFAATAVIGLVSFYFMLSSSVEPCPHPYFIASHLCVHCKTLQDAADFSKTRPYEPMINTVFFGMPRFEKKTYMQNRCGNIDGVPVAICKRTNYPHFECHWQGQNCYGEHAISSGHLYYADIKCF